MQFFLALILVFAAVCLWQLVSGLKQMKAAKADPQHPNSAALYKIGRIRAILGGVMLVGNILLNLPALRLLV